MIHQTSHLHMFELSVSVLWFKSDGLSRFPQHCPWRPSQKLTQFWSQLGPKLSNGTMWTCFRKPLMQAFEQYPSYGQQKSWSKSRGKKVSFFAPFSELSKKPLWWPHQHEKSISSKISSHILRVLLTSFPTVPIFRRWLLCVKSWGPLGDSAGSDFRSWVGVIGIFSVKPAYLGPRMSDFKFQNCFWKLCDRAFEWHPGSANVTLWDCALVWTIRPVFLAQFHPMKPQSNFTPWQKHDPNV